MNVEEVSWAKDYASIQWDDRLAHRGRKRAFYSVGLLEIGISLVELVVLFDLGLF
jgi:hypothetical protein